MTGGRLSARQAGLLLLIFSWASVLLMMVLLMLLEHQCPLLLEHSELSAAGLEPNAEQPT